VKGGQDLYNGVPFIKTFNEVKPHAQKNGDDECAFPLKTQWTFMDVPKISYQDI